MGNRNRRKKRHDRNFNSDLSLLPRDPASNGQSAPFNFRQEVPERIIVISGWFHVIRFYRILQDGRIARRPEFSILVPVDENAPVQSIRESPSNLELNSSRNSLIFVVLCAALAVGIFLWFTEASRSYM